MAKQSTAVATKKPAGETMPDFMREDAGRGQPQVDRSDLEIPRLKLMQGLSKELDSYDALRPGMFFHTSTEDIFKGALKVVPIYFEKRYLLWNPMDSGGGILARADDGVHWSPANTKFPVKLDRKYGGKQVVWKTANTVDESGLANWGTMDPEDQNSQPAATLMYNYLFGFPDYPEVLPAVFTFQRASAKAGKKFNTKLAISTQRQPMFGLVFELSSKKVTNKANQEFHMPELLGAGFLQDADLYREWRDMNEAYTSAGAALNVREEGLRQDGDELSEQPGDEPEEDAEEKPSASGKKKARY